METERGVQVQCLCGARVSVCAEEIESGQEEGLRQVRRYQGFCVCGRVFLLSVASTHGNQ